MMFGLHMLQGSVELQTNCINQLLQMSWKHFSYQQALQHFSVVAFGLWFVFFFFSLNFINIFANPSRVSAVALIFIFLGNLVLDESSFLNA